MKPASPLQLRVDDAAAAQVALHLVRYDELRVKLNLLLVRSSQTRSGLRVEFRDPPPIADIRDMDAAVAARACAWLARVEAAWMRPLGQALHPDELRYDAVLQRFAVGPCLFVPAGDRTVMTALAIAIAPTAGADVASGVDRFQDLVQDLAEQREDLADVLDFGQSDSERIRQLTDRARALATSKEFEGALSLASRALRLAPTDVGIAEDVVQFARRAGRLAAAGKALEVLEQRGTTRARSLWLLAAHAESTDPQRSHELAQRAVLADPGSRDALRQLARSAHGRGDASSVRAALERLAVDFGSVHALKQLRTLAPSAARRALRAWTGPTTPQLLQWRLEAMHREERYTDVLRLFQDYVQHADALSELSLRRVVDAATRVPGRLYAVRTELGKLVSMSKRPSDGLLRVYAEVCLHDRQWIEVSKLDERYPGRVPDLAVLRALLGSGRHGALLRRAASAEQRDAAVASLCVDALVGLGGTQEGHGRLEAHEPLLATALQHSEARARAVAVHEQLCQTAPHHPCLPVLGRLLRGSG